MGFWSDLAAPETFPASVPPDGQYNVTCDWVRPDVVNHTGVAPSSNHYVLMFTINGGAQNGRKVFDFFDDSDHGLRRFAQIAGDLGLDLSQVDSLGWGPEDALDWFVGKSFTVNVAEFRTPYFQDCARIEFDGYVARL